MSVAQDERGLLDTNMVILLPRLTDPTKLPAKPVISAITLAELSVGPLVASSDGERAIRQVQLQQAEAVFDPLPFDVAAGRAFAQVSADIRAAGRKSRARAFDALIAATAIANGLPLFTTNPDDFRDISRLTLVAVDHPDKA